MSAWEGRSPVYSSEPDQGYAFSHPSLKESKNQSFYSGLQASTNPRDDSSYDRRDDSSRASLSKDNFSRRSDFQSQSREYSRYPRNLPSSEQSDFMPNRDGVSFSRSPPRHNFPPVDFAPKNYDYRRDRSPGIRDRSPMRNSSRYERNDPPTRDRVPYSNYPSTSRDSRNYQHAAPVRDMYPVERNHSSFGRYSMGRSRSPTDRYATDRRFSPMQGHSSHHFDRSARYPSEPYPRRSISPSASRDYYQPSYHLRTDTYRSSRDKYYSNKNDFEPSRPHYDRYSQPFHRREQTKRAPGIVDRGTESDRLESKTLFIGSIPYGISESELRKLFESSGNVVAITIPIDRLTGRNRGFAFVEFENRSDAESAFEKFQSYEIEDRRLKIDWDIGVSKKSHLNHPKEGSNLIKSEALDSPLFSESLPSESNNTVSSVNYEYENQTEKVTFNPDEPGWGD